MHSTDVVVLADYSNAQTGYLAKTEQNVEGPFSIQTDCTDSGDSLIQVCSDYGLFEEKYNFCDKK